LLLVVTPGSEPGGRWFDSNPRNFTEVIRPDEEPVLKTGAGNTVASSSLAASAPIKQSRGLAATTPGPHPGNGGSSPSGTTSALIRQLAERLGLNPSVCRFDSCLGHQSLTTRPRGAARSARHPVTVEIVGSNPIGDASIARYANWQSGEAQTFAVCGFDSHPCY
jgi:hypothetical protein